MSYTIDELKDLLEKQTGPMNSIADVEHELEKGRSQAEVAEQKRQFCELESKLNPTNRIADLEAQLAEAKAEIERYKAYERRMVGLVAAMAKPCSMCGAGWTSVDGSICCAGCGRWITRDIYKDQPQ